MGGKCILGKRVFKGSSLLSIIDLFKGLGGDEDTFEGAANNVTVNICSKAAGDETDITFPLSWNVVTAYMVVVDSDVPKYAYQGNTRIEQVVVNAGCKWIGEGAFKNCTQLSMVEFTSRIEYGYIEYAAFEGCSNLTSIEIPSKWCIIGYAFRNCSRLVDVKASIDTDFTSAYTPFEGCPLDTESIPGARCITVLEEKDVERNKMIVGFIEGIKNLTIDMDVFYGWVDSSNMISSSTLEQIEFKNGMGTLSSSLFYGISNLTKIVSMAGIKGPIPLRCFKNCTSLTSVPTIYGDIQQEAFYGCQSLQSIRVEDVSIISESAFYNCSSLDSVELYSIDSLSINSQAFRYCNALRRVELHCTVPMTIGWAAFDHCPSMEEVVLPCSPEIGVGEFNEFNDFMQIWPMDNMRKVSITSGGVESARWYLPDPIDELSIPDDAKNVSIGYDNDIAIEDANGVYRVGNWLVWGHGENANLAGNVRLEGIVGIGEFGLFSPDITSITIDRSLRRLDALSLLDMENLTSVTFLGNAPDISGIDLEHDSPFDGSTNVTIYVTRESTGWGVDPDQPGATWCGRPIRYRS